MPELLPVIPASSPALPDVEEVLGQLSRIARSQLGRAAPLSVTDRLTEDLELDSVGLITLAVAVEDHYRVRLDEQNAAQLVTVGDVVSLIRARLAW
jgi:acyl carrier protein